MKRIIRTLLCAVLAVGLTSCLADLNDRVDELENQVSKLLTSVEQLESYVKSQVYVSDVDSNKEGYVLTLSNGETLQITNGKDGQDGKDGVSVVDGIAGITGVQITDDYVVFMLEDGGKLALPRSQKALNLTFTGAEFDVYEGTASFTIEDALDPYVVVYGDADMKFVVSDIVDNKGTVSFTRGAAASTKIYATVIDNASAGCNTNTKVLRVNFETASYNAEITNSLIPAEGAELSFTFATNCPYSIETPEWISSVETKAVKEHSETVKVAKNEGNRRSGSIKIIDKVSGAQLGSFLVSQKGVESMLYILSEGSWGANNSTLSRLDLKKGDFIPTWYSDVNSSKLGDTGNDIIVTNDYIIIAVNTSNIIQFCDLEGKAVAQTEDIPNCRKLAADPDGDYLYVTSYAKDGYVAKVDLTSFETVAEVNVGYEPEGIAYYNGKLYVANSGGYAYLGTHSYEQSISIVDAETMKEEARVDTGLLNLYGAFVQSDSNPRYILVNAAGDYVSNPAGSLIFDCQNGEVVETFSFPATYACVHNGTFYTAGSSFSYVTYAYDYFFNTINIKEGVPTVEEGIISETVSDAIKNMASPYGIYMTSEGELFVSDAGNYVNRGSVKRFSADGKLGESYTAGVCPGHFAEQ